MWASQMGSFMAQSFQFLYSNVCCALCNRGKKKRAEEAKRRAKLRRLQNKVTADALAEASKSLGAAMLEVGSPTDSAEKGSGGGNCDESGTNNSTENVRPSIPVNPLHRNDLVNKSPNHPAFNPQLHNNITQTNTTDSGHESQQSLDCSSGDRPVRIEILEPEMKEILENCAKYNLDQMKDPEDLAQSTEVLEEIKNAEKLETMRREKLETMRREKENRSSNNNVGRNSLNRTPASSLPTSPQKLNTSGSLDKRSVNGKNNKLMLSTNGGNGTAMSDKGLPIRRGSNISMYDNSPESPLPPPILYNIPNKATDVTMTQTNRASSSSGTPPSKHRSTLGRHASQSGLHNGSTSSSNQLLVTSDKNGRPVTNILKSPGLPHDMIGISK